MKASITTSVIVAMGVTLAVLAAYKMGGNAAAADGPPMAGENSSQVGVPSPEEQRTGEHQQTDRGEAQGVTAAGPVQAQDAPHQDAPPALLAGNPVAVEAPPIRPGDEHDIAVCTLGSESAAFVSDHLQFPDFYLPRRSAEGGTLAVRYPQVTGLHMHLIRREGEAAATLATEWPEESDADTVSVNIPGEGEVDTVVAVVPASRQFYRLTEDGMPDPEWAVTIPATIVSFRLGESPARTIRGARAVDDDPAGGMLMLHGLNQNWFGLSMWDVSGATAVAVEMNGWTVPAVVSAGLTGRDGSTSWFVALAWNPAITVEQAMETPVGVLVLKADASRVRHTVAAPPRAEVSVRPPEPISEATLTVDYFAQLGDRYHVGMFAWPDAPAARGAEGEEDGQEQAARLESVTALHAPQDVEPVVPMKDEAELRVSRSEAWWRHAGIYTARMVPEWPQ